MSFSVRDGKFDVLVVAGPRVVQWPSVGVRALARTCADAGLTVGLIGGDTLFARGVAPLPGTGAWVIAEDAQGRVHRLHGRAVVKLAALSSRPDPFPGAWSEGLLPLTTALWLARDERFVFAPATAILGSGNGALRFGSRLLERGVSEVMCIESHTQWSSKRFAGWEVERRRFEMAGGKLIEARPLSLTRQGPVKIEFRLEDARGIRVLEVARVVSAGPFAPGPGVREFPPGSSLFELDQTAPNLPGEDIEGHQLEEDRALLLASRIVRRLRSELGDEERERVERIARRSKSAVRRQEAHREEPFLVAYQGKWTAPADAKRIRSFSGVPRTVEFQKKTASVECFETIGCRECQRVCPVDAIQFGKEGRILDEQACTACGFCLGACPSGATLMIDEREGRSSVELTLAWRGDHLWKTGELATLVNRRGEVLGSARVTGIIALLGQEAGGMPVPTSVPAPVQLVQLAVPGHLAWEARGLRRPRSAALPGDSGMTAYASGGLEGRVEVTLNGEKRLVRDKVNLTRALFETGWNRAGDSLACPDGSCGLCSVTVDGVKRLACRTRVHPRMAIKLEAPAYGTPAPLSSALCPCLGISREQVVEKIRQGDLRSPDAVVSVTGVGSGRCHGALCCEPLRRVLDESGIDARDWIDWRFPWVDWKLVPGERE